MRNISEKQRVVIKLGTSTLAHKTGKLNIRRMKNLVQAIADLHNSGKDVIIVSSGAQGLGTGKLGLREKPTDIRMKQAVAAIGQCELMHIYDNMFEKYSVTVAQILLTKMIIDNESHCQNFRNTVESLLQLGVIPIINENDAIAIEELELEIGENDSLSALVATLAGADLLLILSDIDIRQRCQMWSGWKLEKTIVHNPIFFLYLSLTYSGQRKQTVIPTSSNAFFQPHHLQSVDCKIGGFFG